MKRSVAVLLLIVVASPLHAEGYGHVTGRIVFAGERPAVGIASRNAPALCVPGGVVVDESLVIGESGGIANVFVYLKSKPATVHPKLDGVPREVVRFEQQGCVFSPHCLIARAGQVIEVESLDPVPHNTHTYPIRNEAANFILPAAPAAAERLTLPASEPLPFPVKCGFYPWMRSHWLILDHPYVTLSGTDGTFTIRNLPVGTHELRLWHERAGYLERAITIVVRAGETTKVPPVVRRLADFE